MQQRVMGSGEEKQPRELTGLAYQELQKCDYRKAVGYFKNAAEKARDEGDVCTMISSYLNAGACLVSRGNLEEGHKLLLSSLKLVKAETASDKHDPAITEINADIYYNLAVAAQKMNNMKQATACFKMSMELYLKLGNKAHAAESVTGLARCHRQAGQSDKEITCLVTAQQLYHKVGESFHEAETCLELARTYLRESKMEDCKKMLSTAKLLCLRIHDNRGLQGTLTCCSEGGGCPCVGVVICPSSCDALFCTCVQENYMHSLGSSIPPWDYMTLGYRTLSGPYHWSERVLKPKHHCKQRPLSCRTLEQLTMNRGST